MELELSQNPKVSVVMSVHNAEDTLREAIDSILEQTYTNWEFVICNDGSTDGTQTVLDEYKQKYPDKFVLLKNDTNMFLSYSLNRCIENSTGELIARMDGDDRSDKTRFEKQVNFLKEHKEYQLVGTCMQRFSDKSFADEVKPKEKPDKYSMRRGTPFCHATIMTYKFVYEASDMYTVSKRTVRGQDYDLWFRFFYNNFSGYNLRESLYYVREDENAIKRRTFKVRFNSFKTMCVGFNLLGFPKTWLIKPFFIMIFKSLVPYKIIGMYRNHQAKQAK